MGDCSRKADEAEERPFGADSIKTAMRGRIRATIEALVEKELKAALGALKAVVQMRHEAKALFDWTSGADRHR